MSSDELILKKWQRKIERQEAKAEAMTAAVKKQLSKALEGNRKGLAQEIINAKAEGRRGQQRLSEYVSTEEGGFRGALDEGSNLIDDDFSGYDDEEDFSDLVGKVTEDY